MIKNKDTGYILFGRAPEPGFGKTRLAQIMGVEAAHRFYSLCLKFQLENLKAASASIPLKTYLFLDVPPAKKLKDYAYLKKENPELKIELAKQNGSTLGERMYNSLKMVSKKHEYAVIQGIDLPCIFADDIHTVYNHLPHASIIPAEDGGWMTLGIPLSLLSPNLFTNIPWSTKDTLQYTLKNLRTHNIHPLLLPRRPDLDSAKDLLRCARWLMKQKTKEAGDRVQRAVDALKESAHYTETAL